MKKSQRKKTIIPDGSLDWRASVKVKDTVAWRLPPLNSETIGGAIINGKRIYSDQILDYGGKLSSSGNIVTEMRNRSVGILSKDCKVKRNIIEKEDDFCKRPLRSPSRGRRNHESKMEYANPVSVFYCAKDSFQRLLDLSSCTTVEVKCSGSVLVPETSLESMILKERTNAGLVSHLPSLPTVNVSYFSSDLRVTDDSEGQSGCSELASVCKDQRFPATSTVLQHLISFCIGSDAILVLELNCFSPFTLSKICAFTFEVCFDRTSLDSASSSSYRKYPKKAYPSLTVQLQEISDTAAVLQCPMQAVAEDLLAGHQVVTTVTCCSKPKACLLRSQMKRIEGDK